jgi:hypothetical protein
MPLTMLRHHGPVLRATARILLASLLPPRRDLRAANSRNDATSGSDGSSGRAGHGGHHTGIERLIAPPPVSLVDRYIAWSGAAGRYRRELPPHMVSQWSTPLLAELLLQLPYKLTRVINQGVTLKINGPLPRGVPLHLRASIAEIAEADGRARVTLQILTSTAQHAALVETQLHLSFILPGPRPAKPPRGTNVEPAWQTAGSWQAGSNDGLQFALLTGDFNPIHWCGPLARRSVFGGKVLHGFGSLVRSYEALPEGSCQEIDIRFLRPVALPSPALQVQTAPADSDGWHALRLLGGAGADTIHLAGRFR